MVRKGRITGCDDDDSEDASRFDTGSGITQLRFPGDAFPVRNLPDIPEPLPMGLLAAHRRAREMAPKLPPKPKKQAAKKPVKKITAKKTARKR